MQAGRIAAAQSAGNGASVEPCSGGFVHISRNAKRLHKLLVVKIENCKHFLLLWQKSEEIAHSLVSRLKLAGYICGECSEVVDLLHCRDLLCQIEQQKSCTSLYLVKSFVKTLSMKGDSLFFGIYATQIIDGRGSGYLGPAVGLKTLSIHVCVCPHFGI